MPLCYTYVCECACALVAICYSKKMQAEQKKTITNCNEFQESALKQFKDHFQFTIVIHLARIVPFEFQNNRREFT